MKNMKLGLIAISAAGLLVNPAAAQPTAHKGGQGRTGSPPPRHPLMAALDADNDGTISKIEIDSAWVALKTLDRNEDGKLTTDETCPPAGAAGSRGPAQAATPFLDRPPLPKTEAEKKILSVLDDLDRNQRHGMMNVPLADGRLLRLLAETIGAKHVVELGTSNGYSGIWLCLALSKTGGRLTTYEIDAYRASLARENFKRAGVDEMVTLIEGDAHVEVKRLKDPIDLLFLDADKKGYVVYLERLLPLVRPGGLVVAHNMVYPPPDPRYLEAITTNPDLETIFLNMDAAGVAVTLKKR